MMMMMAAVVLAFPRMTSMDIKNRMILIVFVIAAEHILTVAMTTTMIMIMIIVVEYSKINPGENGMIIFHKLHFAKSHLTRSVISLIYLKPAQFRHIDPPIA